MNRLTINGVTIEFPSNLEVNIVGSFVTLRHTMDEPAIALPDTDEPNELPSRLQVRPARTGGHLPVNASALILRFLREHKSPAHTIAISQVMKPRLIGEVTASQFSRLIREQLQSMKDDGLIADLANTKQYGGENGGTALWTISKRKGRGNDEHDGDTDTTEHNDGSRSRGALETLREQSA